MGPNANVSYEQLLKMTETIQKAEALRASVAEKEALIKKLESVKIDYTYHELPYKKAIDDLETKSNADTFMQRFRAFLYTALISLLIGGVPYGIYSLLEPLDLIPGLIENYALFIALGLSAVTFVLMYLFFRKRFKSRVHMFYKKRVHKRGQKKLIDVKKTAEKMADAYQSQIHDKLRVLKRALEEDFTNLKGHERKLMQDALVPEHMLPRLPKIAEYIIDHRAESIKEAINLMVKEEREQFYFERLLYGIRHQDIPLEDVLDKENDIFAKETKEEVVGTMLQRADNLSQEEIDEEILDFISVKEEDFIEEKKEETLEDKIKKKTVELESDDSDKDNVDTKSILEPSAAPKKEPAKLKKTAPPSTQAEQSKEISKSSDDQSTKADVSTVDDLPLEEEFELPEDSNPIKIEVGKKEKPKKHKVKKEKEAKAKVKKAKQPKSKKLSKKETSDVSDSKKKSTAEILVEGEAKENNKEKPS